MFLRWLFCIWAKKLIIVGDDKQVSPMAVGTDTDKMSALEQMYLHDKIPNSHLYNAKTSIYDIAATTFQPLMLREHFRCVPEIIGFSNMLSYDYKINHFGMPAAVRSFRQWSIIVWPMVNVWGGSRQIPKKPKLLLL